jgi:starvation-inducible outer membrane lipoprotein
MKTLILLAALSLLSACTTLPPVNGTVANKDGRITLTPEGRIEIVIEPRTGK